MSVSLKKSIVPGIVLVISLGLSFVIHAVLRQENGDQLAVQFDQQARQMTSAVDRQINLYTYTLFSSQGIFAASDTVEQDEWHNYVTALDLANKYPGISGMNYIAKEEGNTLPDRYPVTYIEPLTPEKRKVFGYDVSSEPKRWEAMKQARDTNTPTASAVVPSTVDSQPSFSIYLPVYKNNAPLATAAERAAALRGFVTVAFQVKGLFENITSDPIFDKDISMSIYDTADPSNTDSSLLVFTTHPGTTTSLSTVTTVVVGGRTWSVHYTALQSYALYGIESRAPIIALLTGILLSLLLFFIFYSYATARDRAEQLAKKMTKDLETVSSSQEAVLNGAEYSIISTTLTGEIVTFNAAAERMLGYTRQEMLGTSPAVIHDPQEIVARAQELSEKFHRTIVPGFEVFTATALQEGQESHEWTYVRKDGTRFPVLLAITAIRNSNREVIGFMGIAQDITERRAAEEALKKTVTDIQTQNIELENVRKAMLNLLEDLSKEKAEVENQKAKDEALLGSIGDGVFAVDMDKKIILMNAVAETLSGYTKEEAIGQPYEKILSFLFASSQKPNRDFVDIALKGQKTSMANHTILMTKQGGSVPVADSAAPVMDSTGTVIGAVIVFRDVTREEEIDKAKTEFVSLASHQLRTPLSAIRWYTQLLLEGDAGKVTKQQKEFLQQVDESSARMASLITSLLNVSRIDLGTLASDPVPVDVASMADSVLGELAPSVAARKLVVKREFMPALPLFNADLNLMRILLQNLISNAVKYTPEQGTVTVALSFDKKLFHLSISDTGYGIPESAKAKIFSKLYRADNVKDKDTDGNGLGLYLVKSIVESHDGKVWFESEEGKGTTFYIDLPVSGMKAISGSKTLAPADAKKNDKKQI